MLLIFWVSKVKAAKHITYLLIHEIHFVLQNYNSVFIVRIPPVQCVTKFVVTISCVCLVLSMLELFARMKEQVNTQTHCFIPIEYQVSRLWKLSAWLHKRLPNGTDLKLIENYFIQYWILEHNSLCYNQHWTNRTCQVWLTKMVEDCLKTLWLTTTKENVSVLMMYFWRF